MDRKLSVLWMGATVALGNGTGGQSYRQGDLKEGLQSYILVWFKVGAEVFLGYNVPRRGGVGPVLSIVRQMGANCVKLGKAGVQCLGPVLRGIKGDVELPRIE